jgi:hypothetical protein
VQTLGLHVLQHLDTIDRFATDRDALKLALVANGGFDHRALFPDHFPEQAKEAEAVSKEEFAAAEVDYSEVKWSSPSEDPDGFAKMMELLNQVSSGVRSGDQVAAPQWTEWR